MEKTGIIKEIGLEEIVVEWEDGSIDMIKAGEHILETMELGDPIYQTDGEDYFGNSEPDEQFPQNELADGLSTALTMILEEQGVKEKEWFKKYTGTKITDRDAFYAAIGTVMNDLQSRRDCMDIDEQIARYGDVSTGNVL